MNLSLWNLDNAAASGTGRGAFLFRGVSPCCESDRLTVSTSRARNKRRERCERSRTLRPVFGRTVGGVAEVPSGSRDEEKKEGEEGGGFHRVKASAGASSSAASRPSVSVLSLSRKAAHSTERSQAAKTRVARLSCCQPARLGKSQT